MGKRARIRNGRITEGEPADGTQTPSSGLQRWAPAIAVGAILGILGYSNIRQTSEVRRILDVRLNDVDSKLAELSKSVEQVGKQAAASAPRRGPDPNRVYTIKTDGAPAKGPATAAVTIAEFSDFQ